MKKNHLVAALRLVLFLGLMPDVLWAAPPPNYHLYLDPTTATIQKDATADVLREYAIKAENIADVYNNYTVRMVVDAQTSNLTQTEYELNAPIYKFSDLKSGLPGRFYLKIRSDALNDRDRKLVLKMQILDAEGKLADAAHNDAGEETLQLTITIKPRKNDSLTGYKYLVYVGTNFDLVDGVQANNLFFATNIFVPRYTEATGFSASLYGNRTLTTTDSTAGVYFTSRISPRSDTTAMYFTSAGKLTKSRVTDNIGASFAPLLPLGKLSVQDAPIQLYYSPQFDCIWRRTMLTFEYSDVALVDSELRQTSLIPVNTPDAPLKRTLNYNVYDFYMSPIGFTAVHETPDISVRIYGGIAYNISYTPSILPSNGVTTEYNRRDDWSFIARMWITEPTTGITMQAEVLNNRNHPQPYYGITLSKAFNFKNLSTLFTPITARR